MSIIKSEKVPTSGSEILTPKECSNPVDEHIQLFLVIQLFLYYLNKTPDNYFYIYFY